MSDTIYNNKYSMYSRSSRRFMGSDHLCSTSKKIIKKSKKNIKTNKNVKKMMKNMKTYKKITKRGKTKLNSRKIRKHKKNKKYKIYKKNIKARKTEKKVSHEKERRSSRYLSIFYLILLTLDCFVLEGSPKIEVVESFIFENTDILDSSQTTTGCPIITSQQLYLKNWRWRSNTVRISSKMRNKNVKARNGNGRSNIIKIIHWNAGGRKWENKLVEVEALLQEKNPEICFISEANLWADLPTEDRNIEGYNLLLPNTMSSLLHARIVLLVRTDVKVHILREHMDQDTAAIWLKIGDTKRNSLIIGGLYRQHQLLGQSSNDFTRAQLLDRQTTRWRKLVNRWKQISRNNNCIVIGDTNLDHLRWHDPEGHLVPMVEEIKDNIETSGFTQLISGHTRTWRNQADSCLDQIWSNCTQKTIRTFNETRGSSDHNVVGIDISTRDIKVGGINVVKRLWKQFDKKRFLDILKNSNLNSILDETNRQLLVNSALLIGHLIGCTQFHALFRHPIGPN